MTVTFINTFIIPSRLCGMPWHPCLWLGTITTMSLGACKATVTLTESLSLQAAQPRACAHSWCAASATSATVRVWHRAGRDSRAHFSQGRARIAKDGSRVAGRALLHLHTASLLLPERAGTLGSPAERALMSLGKRETSARSPQRVGWWSFSSTGRRNENEPECRSCDPWPRSQAGGWGNDRSA